MKNGITHGLERRMKWTSAGIYGLRVAWGKGFIRVFTTKIAKPLFYPTLSCVAMALTLSPMECLGTSPEPPPPATLEVAVRPATVIVAKGIKLHWISNQDRISGTRPQLLSGPSFPDGSHNGLILLEAEVIERLRCFTPCAQNKKIYVWLDGYNHRASQINQFIGEPLIYLVQNQMPPRRDRYPAVLLDQWHVSLVQTGDRSNTRTNVYVLEDRPAVEAAIQQSKKWLSELTESHKGAKK